MTWHNEPSGTVVQWAVEYTYGDGEKRYYSDDFDEADAKQHAEVENLERLHIDRELGDTDVVSCRAVSRQVTFGRWTPS